MEAWLRSIGLENRVAAFRDQGLALDLLPELTDADLRELGLTIGERKRFQRAVIALRGDAAPLGVLPAAAPPAVADRRPERRPLSVMFVDLVGYTQLSERFDAEDMLDLLSLYRDRCATIINRFGGHPARFVGDGILALFCYPLANENDPERAVRAGLEIAAAVGDLLTPDGEALRVRVGIATGPVVIGDVFSGSVVDKHSVVGPSPNLAARLQALAEPGEVIVAEETYAAIRGRFVAADRGLVELRGVDSPRRAWRILRERPIGNVAAAPHDAPLCGRDVELASLRSQWARALAGEGGTVMVIGRAGIGKSRLVRAFLESCAGDGGATLQVHASSLDSDSPLRAVVATLRRLTGGVAEPGEPAHLARQRRLAMLGLDEAAWPVVAELLGVGGPPNDTATPEQRREDILRLLSDATLAAADRRPLRIVVEDLHWLDPTSLELVERVASRLAGRRILLLLTAREELRMERGTLPASHTVLPLLPLAELEVLRLVGAMLGGADMPAGVRRSIARRAEGVPLFAQELVRAVAAKRGPDPLDDEAEFGGIVPALVHTSLMARLDSSGSAKEIAQAAAVFGRGCSRAALAAVCGPMLGAAAAELDAAIVTLIRTGVLAQSDSRGQLSFTHSLLRDAAYDSLLRERRRALHLQAALALRATEPELVAEQPERLAMHLTEGGEPLQAAPLWLEAARRGLARSALTEATRLLRRAVDAMPRIPGDRALAEARVELLALLGPAMMALKGVGSPEVAEVYSEARAVCEEAPETPLHFPIYWGWWRLSPDFHDKRDRASTLLSRARSRQDPELLLQAHHCSWGTMFCAGDYARCCEHIEEGLSIYSAHDCTHHAGLYGNHDAKVCGHGNRAQVYWMQGRPARALREEELSLAWAHQMNHLGSRAHARDMELLHRVFRRDYRYVYGQATELVRLGSEHGMADARDKGLIFRGWAQAVCEEPEAGLRMLEEGFAQQQVTGTDEDFPLYVALRAEAMIAAGRPEQAIEMLAAQEASFNAKGIGFWAPEVRRMRAESTLAADPRAIEAALQLFGEAQHLADAQGAAMLALRAAVGAGRIDLANGAANRAASRLASALARIEGDDRGADLMDARVLAERLAAAGVRQFAAVS